MTSQQNILNCQKKNNISMVNKTSIIVSRKKTIHNGVTFKTHIHISNITENDDRNVKYDFDLSDKFYKL